jgi:hypothetical protein
LALLVLASLRTLDPSGAPASAPSEVTAPQRPGPDVPPERETYLTRAVAFSPNHVDHGVLRAALAGGWPHLWRAELALGLFDHLTIGVTTHWLPGQPRPRFNPIVAVAFWRARRFEVGAHYFATLFPPPRDDDDPTTPSFQQRSDWLLGAISFSQQWITAGLDVGVVRGIEIDPAHDPDPQGNNVSVVRWNAATGLHLRAGTRRWGFTARALWPYVHAELAFDVRFGLFEQRSRGGWRPTGIL